MTTEDPDTSAIPEAVDLLDPKLVQDPFGEYSRIRERAPLARGVIPGADPLWIATRYSDVKTVLSDSRFVNDAANVPGTDAPNLTEQMHQASGIPREYLAYLQSGMANRDGADHVRLRRLVARAFTPRRVARLRPRIAEITEHLLDRLPDTAQDGVTDLLQHFAYPLPITVICELVGVAERDRPRWREWSAVLASGLGPGAGEALGGMLEATRDLIEQRRSAPAEDLATGLIQAQDEHGDRLSDTEMISMVLNLVVAGHETTANLISNGTAALLTHPDQLALLGRDPELAPRAVHELMRWCGPALGTLMRYAAEDVELGGELVRKGEAVMPVLAAANYDPRVFEEPERLDITRDPDRRTAVHVGFGAGPHHCLGAVLAREEAEVAFTALLRRFPGLALAVAPQDLQRGPNPGTWHLAALPVRLRPQKP